MNAIPNLTRVLLLTLVLAVTGGAAQADAVSDVLEAIADESPDVRAQAVADAGPLGAAAIGALGQRLDDDPPTGLIAHKALTRIVHHAARPDADTERVAVAAELAKLVATELSDTARREVIHLLSLVAGENEVPALAALLENKAVAQDACLALERIPGNVSAQALIGAIALSTPALRLQLMPALANRRVSAAIPVLEAEARGPDAEIAWAALDALARLGVSPLEVFPPSPAFTQEQKRAYGDAFIAAGHANEEMGRNDMAERVYAYIASSSPPDHRLCAALTGLARVGSEKLIPQALGVLAEPSVRAVATRALSETGLPAVDQALADAFGVTVPVKRSIILEILLARNAPQLAELLETARSDDAPEVRMTAIELSGEEPDRELLEAVLAGGSPEARGKAARRYLELARAELEADKPKAAHAMFELVVRSRAPVAEKISALQGIRGMASPASLPLIDELVGHLREQPRGQVSRDLAVATGRAAATVYASLRNRDRAIEKLQSLLEGPAPEEVTKLATAKLAELGVESSVLAQRQGFITDWEVLGPFPNPDNSAFGKPFFDETGRSMPDEVEFDGKQYDWQVASTGQIPATIDLTALFDTKENVAAYAYTEIPVDKKSPVAFLVGSDDGCEFWVNGKKLHAAPVPRSLEVDQDRVECELQPGYNRVLIKVLQGGSDWQFCVRVVGKDGNALDLSRRRIPVDSAVLHAEQGEKRVNIKRAPK